MMNEKERPGISRMRCSEIMTRDVRTASSQMTLREVAVLMRDGDMGSVPVVDEGKLIGIVTDRDIVVRVLADGKGADAPVSDAMTTQIVTVSPEDYVFEAIRLMGDKQVRRIPVVEKNGQLSGIISMADIALETEDEREIAETLEEISSGAGFWKKNDQ
jgi:CBS domain-containing protein